MIFWPLQPVTRLDGGIGGFLRYQTWFLGTGSSGVFIRIPNKYLLDS